MMRNVQKAVTLKDIAVKTGYSINTVSLALRNSKNVLPETKEKILKAAKDLGYVENSLAQSMRRGYTKTVAVIIGDVSNPHFAILMKEVEKKASQEGYTVFLLNSNEDEETEAKAINLAIQRSVDGIIICPCQKSDKNINFLKDKGIPFVLMGRRSKHVETNYCICNDEMGGYLATRYLISKGHKKILNLAGPSYISSARERLDGYKKALREAGLPIDKHLIQNVSVLSSDVSDVLKKVPLEDYTAVVAFSDLVGWQAWSYFEANGVKIPDDKSIIGFDHIESRLRLPLGLASISSYKARMSSISVDLLLTAIKAEEYTCCHIIIDTNVVEGKSVKEI